VSDPLVEHDHASQRRSTFLVAAVGVIVLVVVALTILRSAGPEDQPKVDQPVSPSARLSHSSTLVDQALATFQDQHDFWPERAYTKGRDLVVEHGKDSTRYNPGVDQGVQMGWYRGDDDRFAYCLTRDLHAMTVITTGTQTTKHETAGACPAASLTPDLSTE
jgi:hypothetical protein